VSSLLNIFSKMYQKLSRPEERRPCRDTIPTPYEKSLTFRNEPSDGRKGETTMNDKKDITQVMRDARWNMRDLQIIAETTRQNGMVWIPDVLEETANNIEYLLMELEKLGKREG